MLKIAYFNHIFLTQSQIYARICIFYELLSTLFKNHAPKYQYAYICIFNAEKETMLFQRRSQVHKIYLDLCQAPKPFSALFKIVHLFSTF